MVFWKELWTVIFKHKAILLINLFFLCLLSFSGPFALYAQAYFIDKVESMVGAGFIISELILPTFLLLLSFLLPMLSILTGFFELKYNHSIGIIWCKRINEIIKDIPYYHYEHEETYDKIKQLGDNNMYLSGISCIFSTISILISILFYSIVLVNISLWLMISVIVLAPAVGYFSSKIADKQYRKIYKMNPDRRRGIYKSSILRSREFAKDIRLNKSADYMINEWENIQKNIDLKALKIKFKFGFLSALIAKSEYIVIFINLTIVLLSFINGSITVGIFISISNQIFSMRMLTKVQGLISQLTTTRSMRGIYLEVLELTQKKDKEDANIHIDEPVIIEFKNVSFKYPQQDEFILDNLNFRLQSGESVAIVGENGAGKSTLIKLLLGLYIPNEGRILINGNNLSTLSLLERSKIFGVAFQDFAKFCLPLKENITLGENEEDFENKAKHLELDILADSLSDGFDTLLGKSFGNAIDISGGQWQAVAIMRALVGERKVLIFDEPTAFLDPIREVEMFEKINYITQNKISIFITHRLGFTTKVDRIILIKDKQIIEDGSFTSLIKEDGEFKKMFEMQKSMYIKKDAI